ncbi:hypothetical protein Mgra_00000660, partial [Meloidogyne graminicola]
QNCKLNNKQLRVCDPFKKLKEKDSLQLNNLLNDLEKNISCQCLDGCERKNKNDTNFKTLLILTNSERVEESGGEIELNKINKQIWENNEIGDNKCDNNGMLLIYIRDNKKLSIYQGHNKQFKIYSNKDIANLHELAIQNNNNETITKEEEEEEKASSFSSSSVQQSDWNWVPVIGLTLALALTFLVLFILLCLLLAKCFNFCCSKNKQKRRKYLSTKYYVNPLMPPSNGQHYKSVEPIYIVTPTGSGGGGGIGAPPSSTSIYGTVSNGHHFNRQIIPPPLPHSHLHHSIIPTNQFPTPIPPPHLIQQQYPHSRSMTPVSTYRIKKLGENGRNIKTNSLIQSSMQSTPEANKRDKIVNRTMTVPVTNNNKNIFQQQQQQIIERNEEILPSTSSLNISPPPPLPPHHPSQTPILPFLDPWRKQEVQTREQFIG